MAWMARVQVLSPGSHLASFTVGEAARLPQSSVQANNGGAVPTALQSVCIMWN
jgi:hypothetical protein